MRLTLFLIAFLSLTSPSLAEVITTTSTEYYPVLGNTKNEIMKDIKKKSTKVVGKRITVAHQQASIKYKFSWKKQKGKCSVTKTTIKLHITYRFPKLAQTPNLDTRLWWRKFIKNLEKHEFIHGSISKKGAAKIDKELRSTKINDCNNIKEIVEARFQVLAKRLSDEQAAYDKLTDHGIKQERYKGY